MARTLDPADPACMRNLALLRHLAVVALTMLVIAAGCGGASTAKTPDGPPASRAWFVQVAEYVKVDKPTPPGTARLYAYVAKAYGDTRATESVAQANEAARQVANAVMPQHTAETDAFATTVAQPPARLAPNTQRVIDALVERSKTDNWQADNNAAALAAAPIGAGHWVQRGNLGPFAPSAGTWQRWIVPADADFAVPPPPRIGSAEYKGQLQEVAAASKNRTAEQVAIINYYGGVPGTEGPSGIWLNQLWKRVQNDPIAKDDKKYSHVQSILAQTLADAFMECWRVKYQYWTARPDMVDPTIRVSMPNPPFPSYVSGHSTISAAGATVLGSMLPEHQAAFLGDAHQARDSRLWAGIHFPIDNEQGFALGTKVGKTVIATSKGTDR